MAINNLANRLNGLQRAYLDSSQKRQNGNFSIGTSGINVTPAHTAEWRPSMGDRTVQNLPNTGQTGMVSYLASQAQKQQPVSAAPVQPGTKVMAPTSGTGTTGTASTTTTTGAGQGLTFSGDYAAEAQKLMTQLQQIYSTPFQYSYANDPAYIAAQQAANNAAAEAKDQTYADMADRGIMNSSITAQQLGNIETKSRESVLQLIPGLEQNAYNRFIQGQNNQANVITTMLGQLNNDRAFEADQRWKEADVTGTYESPEYKSIFDSLIAAKQGYAGTIDAASRAQFAQQGKDARAALAQLTGRTPEEIDKMFGANVGIDAALANYGMGGTPTMTSQRYAVEDKRYQDEMTYKKDQDKQAQKNWEAEFGLKQAADRRAAASAGGGGLTFSQQLDTNTNRMAAIMLSQVSTLEQANQWIKNHAQDIYEGGISPGDLRKQAEGFFGGGDSTPKDAPSQMDIAQKALDAAYKDPEWEHARDDPAKQQAIINKWTVYYQKAAGLSKPVDPLDSLYNLATKFFPNLGKPKATTSGGGSKSVYQPK